MGNVESSESDRPKEVNKTQDRSISIGIHLGLPEVSPGRVKLPLMPCIDVGQDSVETVMVFHSIVKPIFQIQFPSVNEMNDKIDDAYEKNCDARKRKGWVLKSKPSHVVYSGRGTEKITREWVEEGVSFGLHGTTLGFHITNKNCEQTEYYAPIYFVKAMKTIRELDEDTVYIQVDGYKWILQNDGGEKC